MHDHDKSNPTDDASTMATRYARRAQWASNYSPDLPVVQCMLHEREHAVRHLLTRQGWHHVAHRKVVDVGCGDGRNLNHLMSLGFAPQNLVGIDLLPERVAMARATLPPTVTLMAADATVAPVAPASQDLVVQFTVFSSLLQSASRQRLAAAMWSWLKPGGAVMSYDFVVASPRNRDVRKLTLAQLRALFPAGQVREVQSLTLAPPLARALCGVHASLYGVANRLPWLRTHRMVWIEKPAS